MPLSVWEGLSLPELTPTCMTLELADRSVSRYRQGCLIQSWSFPLPSRLCGPCEEYSQEVLGFSNVTDNDTLTPQNDPIVFVTSHTLTPFGDSDFLLFEEADAFLGLEDDPNSPKINPFYYDP
nr:reverse transcriptase domain-containing protein [Tanacetum cinerariifolium]